MDENVPTRGDKASVQYPNTSISVTTPKLGPSALESGNRFNGSRPQVHVRTAELCAVKLLSCDHLQRLTWSVSWGCLQSPAVTSD